MKIVPSNPTRVASPLFTGVLFIAAVLVSGCAFSRLKTDVQTAENAWLLDVRVAMDEHAPGKVLAVAYTPYKDGQRIAAFKVVDPKLKRTILILEPGDYRFALVHDLNGNLMIDPQDPVAMAERGRRLKFSDVVKRIELEMDLPTAGTLPEGFPRELANLPADIEKNYHLAVGDLMNIDDAKFSASAGKMGLWEPSRFLKENGAGIYMLNEFDPTKTPVLFVNGAGGSAQNWRYFFDHLDKTRFQAWFYLYPSGMRIAPLGRTLNTLIRAMQTKYNVAKLHVVAHSMGGLVSREAIVRHISEEAPSIIGQFVTISTPWNGHRMAEKGVRALSVPVPSWHDVVPGSEFLQTVFNSRLKGKVPHHLLFGYQVGSEGDGSVDLNSVLLAEAQDDAVEVRAFEADHVKILSLESVLEYVENILIDDDEGSVTSSPCPEPSVGAEENSAPTPGS